MKLTHAALPYRLSFDQNEFDLDVIHGFLSEAYWSKDIPFETLKTSWENSLSIAILTADGKTIGGARMITDKATFGYLGDVFILEDQRGQGLAHWLMETLMSHPDLQGLRRIMLATHDMHALYLQHGFTDLKKPEVLMEITNPGVYRS